MAAGFENVTLAHQHGHSFTRGATRPGRALAAVSDRPRCACDGLLTPGVQPAPADYLFHRIWTRAAGLAVVAALGTQCVHPESELGHGCGAVRLCTRRIFRRRSPARPGWPGRAGDTARGASSRRTHAES